MTITRWVLLCRRHSSSSASSVGHSLCRDVSHSATTSGSSVSPGMRISSHGPGTPAARHLATCSRRLVPSSSAPAARSTRAASGKPSTPFTTPHTRMPIPRQREITASALLRRSARSNSNWGYCRTATPPVYVPYELNLISTPSIDKGQTRLTACLSGAFCPFRRLVGLSHFLEDASVLLGNDGTDDQQSGDHQDAGNDPGR